ncbi:MAG: alpha/beta hydrolase [Rectinemataceae bacterium]
MSDTLIPLLAFGIPGIVFLLAALGFIVYRGLIFMPVKDEAFISAWCRERGDLDDGDLALPWILERVRSPGGYDIAVHALEGEGRGLVLVQHGITWSWLGMMRYARAFRAEGWTVVALDARGHGDTGGGRPSYGWHERYDLKAVADWALSRFPHEGRFAALGVSMGASAVLHFAAVDERLDAVVADCPFSNMAAELDHRLKKAMLPFFMRPAIVRIADAFCRRGEGFSIYDIGPDRATLETEVPILFVHGLADDYVPWKMSVVMAERRRRELPEALTVLRLVPEAKHARSIAVDPEGYVQALREFFAAVAERKAASGA